MMNFLKDLGKWARYAYFLRFAWLLWLFAPMLCLMNIGGKTITSGILVAEYWQQYLCIAFFVVSAGFAALVLGRIALINGPDRWDLATGPEDDGRPSILKDLFVNDKGDHEFLALVIAQAPNLFVFTYLLHFGVCQGVDPWAIIMGFVVGTLLAFVFWWNANAWYYLTFKAPALDPAPLRFVLGKNIARTVLFPRSLFWLNKVTGELPGGPTIEQAETLLSHKSFAKFDHALRLDSVRRFLIERSGYGKPGGSSFYEAHNFAAISLVLFFGLYLVLWPLTAPIVAPVASWIAIAAMGFIIAFILIVFWTAAPAVVNEKKDSFTGIRVWITVTILVFYVTVILLYIYTAVERFPIFATILILMISLAWIVGAIAFFVDRYRVPVVTLLLIALIVPRVFHLDRTYYFANGGLHAGNGQEEHYLSITTSKGQEPLLDPQTVLAARLQSAGYDRPLVIITATGGGLHASAWTATMLAHLEATFGPDFRKHLLLASTVSGGSVGLLSYLNELHSKGFESDFSGAVQRMESSAQCSSLEGVGWGLVYYDLPKALVPVIPYAIPPSSGDNDLDTAGAGRTPLLKDRTWALRKSFLRNLDDSFCRAIWKHDTNPSGDEATARTKSVFAGDRTGSGLTVRDFPADPGPAFTMNTTVVETGERFLSANYKVPNCRMEDDPNPDYRARSFLETFKALGADPKAPWSDLPLATAAQLSATFPYVSSAARAPMVVDNSVEGVHFADGGYYDNDGTASAIEFLRYALGPSSFATDSGTAPASAKPSGRCPALPLPAGKLRILLIEIRNSDGINGSGDESSPYHNGGKAPWNLFSQAVAPLLGFWQAGHESVTPRNQSGLELLEHTYTQKLIVKSVVLADQWSADTVGTDPLNWSLTPKQRKEVRDSAERSELKDLYKTAKKWYCTDPTAWSQPPADDGGPASSIDQCSAH